MDKKALLARLLIKAIARAYQSGKQPDAIAACIDDLRIEIYFETGYCA